MKTQYIKKDNVGIIYYSDSEMTIEHREDGPSSEYASGSKFWFKNNKLHRIGGPAAECSNGDRVWYVEGKRHREDGPAYTSVSGWKGWYLNGNSYTEEEFNQKIKDQNNH